MNDVECGLRDVVYRQLLARNVSKNSSPLAVDSHIGDTGVPMSAGHGV